MRSDISVGYLNTIVALVRNLLDEFVLTLSFESKILFIILVVVMTAVLSKYRPASQEKQSFVLEVKP